MLDELEWYVMLTSANYTALFSFSINRFLILSLSTFSKFLYKFSIEPYFSISGPAVFGPIPLTPGILSIESPTNAKKSVIDFG